mmetsp:Transcript_35803/g.143085  ORF Transcript_35803/g.143085 Transcript_35803/m.143085 type:complete len:203 (-) Transcript_35803:1143-1751(-)
MINRFPCVKKFALLWIRLFEELKDVPAEYQELLSSMSSLAAEAGAEMESQMYALVEAEQSRLDESYSEMQKNLLRSMSSTINEYLPEVIKAKIAEEIAKVAEDVSATLNKSIRESTESSFQTAIEAAVASTKEEVSGATAEALQKVATSAKVREAFGAAFIKVLLPSFEDSTRSFLSSFSVYDRALETYLLQRAEIWALPSV